MRSKLKKAVRYRVAFLYFNKDNSGCFFKKNSFNYFLHTLW